VFVDAEVEPEHGTDWLAPLLSHLDDPTVGACAPRVRAAGDDRRALVRYDRARSPLDLGPAPAAVHPGGVVAFVPTTALVARRAALDAVGGFDTTLCVGEDVDLVWRLTRAGWRVRYEPAAAVTHPTRPTVGAWLRQRAAYGASAAPLVRRHGDAATPLRLPADHATAWLAVLSGRPVLAATIGAGAFGAQVRQLERADVPRSIAVPTVAAAGAWGARHVADALRRPWWPGALAAALVWRRARPALLAAAVVPALVDAWERRPELGLVPFGVLRLADDVAYGTGVWIGAARERSARALLPSITRRRRSSSPAARSRFSR
jgi:mycofactocin system glycosyltransferase